MHQPTHLPAFLLGLSSAFILGAILLLRRRVQHNPWFGIRTPTNLCGMEATWYANNRRKATAFLAIGLLLLPAAYAVGLIHL